MNRLNEIEYWRYNARDCVSTWEIDEEQIKRAEKKHQKQMSVVEFQNSMFGPLFRMTARGIKVDERRREEIRVELVAAIQERQRWLEEVLGHPINLASHVQVKKLFYIDLGQKAVRRFKQGKWVESCDDKALETIAGREPLLRQIITPIQEIRTCCRLLETFIDGAELRDGRLCCLYDVTGTKTYRFAHRKTIFGYGTNLGNIPAVQKPKPNEIILPNIRGMFIPDTDFTYFDVDLDSADLNIVAWESGCRELQEMLIEGYKVYVELAKEYYHDSTIDKNHWAYKLFKSLCHGTNYLGQAAGLAGRLGLSVYEVGKIQKWYFGKFKEIKDWQGEVKKQINGRGWVENVFGHRCYFLGKVSDKSYREGIAWIPQSTVARIIDTGLVRIDALEQIDRLPIYLLNQVHDSLNGEFPTSKEEELLPLVLDACRVELPYDRPRTIPVGVKTSTISWGECE